MTTHINIKIGAEEFVAELLTGDAPKTIGKTLAVLPIEGKLWHTGWMGDACVLTPDDILKDKMVYFEPENQTMFGGSVMYSVFPGNQAPVYPMARETICLLSTE